MAQTKAGFEAKIQKDARRWLNWLRCGGPAPKQRLTKRVRKALREIAPDAYNERVAAFRAQIAPERPPIVMAGSKLRVEQTHTETIFTSMVAGWRD